MVQKMNKIYEKLLLGLGVTIIGVLIAVTDKVYNRLNYTCIEQTQKYCSYLDGVSALIFLVLIMGFIFLTYKVIE